MPGHDSIAELRVRPDGAVVLDGAVVARLETGGCRVRRMHFERLIEELGREAEAHGIELIGAALMHPDGGDHDDLEGEASILEGDVGRVARAELWTLDEGIAERRQNAEAILLRLGKMIAAMPGG
jgi:hypothetical protein